MKALFAFLFVAMSGVAASAQTDTFVVPYGDNWTPVPYCGGYTRLTCDDVSYAKEKNRCHIEFSGVACQHVKMYVGNDFYPTWNTIESQIQSSFYVDYNRMSIWNKRAVNVFLSTSKYDTSSRVRLQYQFNY